MRNYLFLLIFVLMTLTSARADDSSWQPIPAWPFIYSDFIPAVIHTNSGKTVNAKANIHIGHHYLWYTSNGKNLEAKKGTVKEVVFSDGKKYIVTSGKLCRIISEDDVKGEKYRLLYSIEVDMPRYNEIVRNQKAAEGSSTLDIMGLNDMNLDMSVRESANIAEQEPLPIKDVFYFQIGKETFEATESNILKHLDKEERKAYRAYTRRAEIITGNINSMIDVYTTFFLK